MKPLRVVFMGSPDLGLPCLEALSESDDFRVPLVVTAGARRRRRRGAREETPIGQAALALNLPMLTWEKGEREAVEAAVAAAAPDLVVVIALARILKPSLLAIPRLGCLNLHASLLPWGRGASPIQQAILDGLESSGWTAMLMDEGLDTGPMLDSLPLPIGPRWTGGDLYQALKEVAPAFLLGTLRSWAAGNLQPTPQDESQATWAPLIDRSAGAIDWTDSAAVLDRRIRSLAPAPGSWCVRQGRRLGILEAIPSEIDEPAPAGKVLQADSQAWQVACGSGSLHLLRVKPEGRGPQSFDEYLRGRPCEPGEILERG